LGTHQHPLDIYCQTTYGVTGEANEADVRVNSDPLNPHNLGAEELPDVMIIWSGGQRGNYKSSMLSKASVDSANTSHTPAEDALPNTAIGH
jgi:hypothetical protein